MAPREHGGEGFSSESEQVGGGAEGRRGSCAPPLSLHCWSVAAAVCAVSWACGRCANAGERCRVALAGEAGGSVPEVEGCRPVPRW